MAKVALVTCCQLPEPDTDEAVLLDACLQAGLDAEYVGWDDPGADWTDCDAAVIRSTWNYYRDEAGFRAWVERASHATRLINPADVVSGNLNKEYLAKFERAGIPIVPTRFVKRGDPADLGRLLAGLAWDEFVIKPAVSAASFMTRRFSVADIAAAEAFLGEVVAQRDAMVQMYLPLVAGGGEVNLVFIDGELTHGIIKHPRFDIDPESVSGAIQPTVEQRALAERVMATLGERPLFGRVDLMEVQHGQWALSELELIEPSLFFAQYPPALDRFVEALSLSIAGS